MENVMRGLVKENAGPGNYVYHTDLPLPKIAADEVLIRIHCAAICATDMHIMEWDEWSRKRMRTPLIAGHEMAGEIIATGANVRERKVGDRVSCETHVPCGECYFCENNMPHICRNIDLLGVTIPGAFAEYMKIRWSNTFVLDDGVSDEAACMFEPMGAGIHGVESAQVAGKVVLVSGCGPIGLTAVSGSKTFGAKLVIACDLVDERLQDAKDMGADVVFNSEKCDLVEEILKLTDGVGADAAIDVTGAGPAIRTGIKSVRAAGRVVCVGLPTKPVELDLANDLIYREVELTGISGRKIWDTWEDFATVMKGPYFKLDKVLGGKFRLEEFDRAVEQIRSGAGGKMLLYP